MPKQRADQLLVSQGVCASLSQAQRLIMAGKVSHQERIISKSSQTFEEGTLLCVVSPPKYVSRAGFKLAAGLDHFSINPKGYKALDIGASTGGFSDCLLQRGAAHIYTIDVGTNQLAWKIRSDSRVSWRENFNARQLTLADIGEQVDLIVIDVSFISLTKILPQCFSLLKNSQSHLVCLIKPQFELERHQVSKGGIITDETLRQQAVDKIKTFCHSKSQKTWKGCMPSPILGTNGNQEYLAWLQL